MLQPTAVFSAALDKVKCQLGLKSLHSVLVVHCAHAYAAVLEGQAGWKVVFSGDTRPCEQLVAAAQDATLLIHEVCVCVSHRDLVCLAGCNAVYDKASSLAMRPHPLEPSEAAASSLSFIHAHACGLNTVRIVMDCALSDCSML